MKNTACHPWGAALALAAGLLLAGCSGRPPANMAVIPAGPFLMGSDRPPRVEGDALQVLTPLFAAEAPQHEVTLPVYALDRYEVTNAEYAGFVQSGHRPPPHWKAGTVPPGQENLPVVNVTWQDAQAYCRWVGKRLPTEAEWEKAARGPTGLDYPWGNTFEADRLAAGGELTSVGSLEAGKSPYGLYDMAGNVWEWTTDWYQPYPGMSRKVSEAFGRRYKVVRGGAYVAFGGHYVTFIYRTSFRFYFAPDRMFVDVGFRCAKSL